MEKSRNCTSSYPVYPTYGGMMPGPMPISGVNMPMPMPYGSPTPYMNTTFNTDTNLEQRVSNLEQRINNLENMLGNSSYSSTSYNTTNYQMM